MKTTSDLKHGDWGNEYTLTGEYVWQASFMLEVYCIFDIHSSIENEKDTLHILQLLGFFSVNRQYFN